MEIEILARQGKGIREIARMTGLARNTVRDVIRGQSDGQYGPRRPKNTKLDDHKSYVAERLRGAGSKRIAATVLLRELRERGYDGGVTQLKEFVREIRPAPESEPLIRFETPPGKQMQADFVVFRRGPSPLRAFTAELAYSRYSFVEFTDNERADTLIACLERALLYFGGVPEQILCDNPKTIVLERHAYGDGLHRFNPLLLDFVKHYGLRVKLCAPYRAQTKGKIERFHRYLRESFFVPLQTQLEVPVDTATANREVRGWLHNVAAQRMHATLRERPIDRFLLERPLLRPLPMPFAGHRESKTPNGLSVPMPTESLQHPLRVYDDFAKEIQS